MSSKRKAKINIGHNGVGGGIQIVGPTKRGSMYTHPHVAKSPNSKCHTSVLMEYDAYPGHEQTRDSVEGVTEDSVTESNGRAHSNEDARMSGSASMPVFNVLWNNQYAVLADNESG